MTVRFLSFPVLHSSLVSLSKNAAPPQGRAQKTSGGRHSGFPSQGPLSFCGCKGTAILRTVQVFSQKSCKIFFTRHSLAREHIIYCSPLPTSPRGGAESRIGTLHLAKIANVHLAKITNAHLAKRTATRPTPTVSVQSFFALTLGTSAQIANFAVKTTPF